MVAEVRSGGIGNRAREQHALKDKGRKSTSMSACPEVGVCVCVCVSHAGVTHQGVCVGGGGAGGDPLANRGRLPLAARLPATPPLPPPFPIHKNAAKMAGRREPFFVNGGGDVGRARAPPSLHSFPRLGPEGRGGAAG